MILATNSQKSIPHSHSLIAAGPAVEVEEGYDLLDLNQLVTGGRSGFISFTVTGDSMVDHIHPGNLIFVDTDAAPRHNSIVACMVNGLMCVKIFQHSTRGLYLVSRNENYERQQIRERDSFRVVGVVTAWMGLVV
jgi:SOS-response transcriptional repressor LexA